MESRLRPLEEKDLTPLLDLLEAGAVFRPNELEVAREVLEAALTRGAESGYRCVVAEDTGRPVGFSCWGPTPGTEGTFDLYWIAVHPAMQRKGLASRLLDCAADEVARSGGRLLVVETSDSGLYAAARAFYESKGFRSVARIPDFYQVGDAKIIYTKNSIV